MREQLTKILVFSSVLQLSSPPAKSENVTVSSSDESSLTASEKHQSRLLKSGISHSDKLPPLDSKYRAGATFDLSELKKKPSRNIWFRIPNWAAGRWKQQTTTNFYRKDLNTGRDSFDPFTYKFILSSYHSTLRDRAGNVWEMRAPGSNLGEKDAEYVIELIEDMEPLECDENHMTIKYIGTAIRVSKFNKRIRKSEQVECITTTTISGTNLLKDICSIKIFDDDGIALRLGKSLSYDVRTADFSPATNANGKNLAPLFREYLITHGLANLVP